MTDRRALLFWMLRVHHTGSATCTSTLGGADGRYAADRLGRKPYYDFAILGDFRRRYRRAGFGVRQRRYRVYQTAQGTFAETDDTADLVGQDESDLSLWFAGLRDVVEVICKSMLNDIRYPVPAFWSGRNRVLLPRRGHAGEYRAHGRVAHRPAGGCRQHSGRVGFLYRWRTRSGLGNALGNEIRSLPRNISRQR